MTAGGLHLLRQQAWCLLPTPAGRCALEGQRDSEWRCQVCLAAPPTECTWLPGCSHGGMSRWHPVHLRQLRFCLCLVEAGSLHLL